MFTHYLVSLSVVRSKLPIIKLVRAINGWGLKDSKDWAEDNFAFDDWMSYMATVDITVTEEQLGRLMHYMVNNVRSINEVEVHSCEKVLPNAPDMFDFTRQIF